jgi:cleavage and polyadenylation specificity factor subunit 3
VEQKRSPRSDDQLLRTLDAPGIHISSSGMMFERTLSNKLAQLMLGDERHGIFFVGYTVEHSPGAKLLAAAAAAAAGEGPEEVVLEPSNGAAACPIRAEVRRFRFSGHAHRRDLVELVGQMQAQTVVLVHGEPEAKEWMRAEIAARYPGVEIVLPEQGKEIEL